MRSGLVYTHAHRTIVHASVESILNQRSQRPDSGLLRHDHRDLTGCLDRNLASLRVRELISHSIEKIRDRDLARRFTHGLGALNAHSFQDETTALYLRADQPGIVENAFVG